MTSAISCRCSSAPCSSSRARPWCCRCSSFVRPARTGAFAADVGGGARRPDRRPARRLRLPRGALRRLQRAAVAPGGDARSASLVGRRGRRARRRGPVVPAAGHAADRAAPGGPGRAHDGRRRPRRRRPHPRGRGLRRHHADGRGPGQPAQDRRARSMLGVPWHARADPDRRPVRAHLRIGVAVRCRTRCCPPRSRWSPSWSSSSARSRSRWRPGARVSVCASARSSPGWPRAGSWRGRPHRPSGSSSSRPTSPAREHILPIVFVAIFATVVIYGLTAAPVARLLGVAEASGRVVLVVGGTPWARAIAASLKGAGFGVRLWSGRAVDQEAARAAGLTAERGKMMLDAISRETELEDVTDALLLDRQRRLQRPGGPRAEDRARPRPRVPRGA